MDIVDWGSLRCLAGIVWQLWISIDTLHALGCLRLILLLSGSSETSLSKVHICMGGLTLQSQIVQFK